MFLTASLRDRIREWSPVFRRRALWGGLAGVLLVGSLLAFAQGGHTRSHLIQDATASADALVQAALVPELTPQDAVAPATGTRWAELQTAAERQVLADGTVTSLTIWSPDGTILFADELSLVGQQVRSVRTTVLAVLGDESHTDVLHGVLRTFVPVELDGGISVAVELDRSEEPIASAVAPWRLMGILFGLGALLAGLLLARAFSRYGRRAEGFDEDALRAALAARRVADRARQDADARREHVERELEHVRTALHEVQERARDAERVADDAPRLREHLALAAEDIRRAEEERDALRVRLTEAGKAVEAEAVRGHEEVAGALAEIERLEDARASLQDRAARAEEAVTELTRQVAGLQGRPDIEVELAAARREADAARRELAAERERSAAAEARSEKLEEETDEVEAKLRDLERKPDLSAKVEAATIALDIARDQIRALTAKADEADAEASRLRAEHESRRAARSKELEDAERALAGTRSELEAATAALRAAETEADALRDETVSLHHQADAAGAMIAGANAELHQAVERVKELTDRAEEAEAALAREREAGAAASVTARAELGAARAETSAAEIALAEALAELSVSNTERDAAAVEHQRALGELTAERDALATEHERALGELTGERDRALAAAAEETDRLRVELEVTASERAREVEEAAEAAGRARSELEALRAELSDRKSLIGAVRAELSDREVALRTERTQAELARRDAEAARAEVEDLRRRSGADAAADAERIAELAAATGEMQTRIGELEALLAGAEARVGTAEEALAGAEARVGTAEEALAGAEARFHRVRFTEALGATDPVTVSAGPDGPSVEVQPTEQKPKPVNGMRALKAPKGRSKVEVDTLVRRVVQESWSDRGRKVSVYAEPITVEASNGEIEGLLDAMLERSLQRTTEGNRLVVHVERADGGVLLSVEDGQPPSEDAMSPKARRIAVEHGGWAAVERHPGGGAIFRVWLPRTAAESASASSA